MYNIKMIQKVFSENPIVNIVFTKKDGSERKMRCTTNLALIPILHHPKKKIEDVEKSDKVITSYSVYDLDKLQWRSFVIENLIAMEADI